MQRQNISGLHCVVRHSRITSPHSELETLILEGFTFLLTLSKRGGSWGFRSVQGQIQVTDNLGSVASGVSGSAAGSYMP